MTKQLNIDIIAKDKTKRALTGVQNRLNLVKSSVFSLKGALIGIGAGAAIRSFVNVGKEVESLQVRFKFLFGSVEEGAVAFDNLTKFAGKVPFSLEEISRASGNLAVVADDANDLNRILEITGNVAAVTGLDFETTSSQIQRAFSGGIGAADLFRERGVRALLGFQAGAKVTAEETVEKFEELFAGDGRFANATKDLATTLEGTISMIGDKYFNFQKDVAEGFFDELKKEFGDLNTFLADNEKQIEDIAKAIGSSFATAITKTSQALKDVAPAFKQVATTSGQLIDGFNSLPSEVKTAGIIAVLLFGKKGFAVAAALSLIVDRITDIADVAQDLTIIDPNELKNADAIQDRLILLNEEIEKTKQSIGTPLELNLIAGVEADVADLLNIDAQKEYNRLIDERNKLTRILNNLNFESSDFYSNVNKEIIANTENQKLLREEQTKAITTNQELAKSMQKFAERNLTTSSRIYQTNKEIRDKETADALAALDEQERINNQKLENERRFLDELKKGRAREIVFEEMTQEKKKEILIGAGKDILGNLATFNKEAFRLNQALAIGDAIMSTAQGVAAGLKKGFPVGYIEAAITAAKGAAQIAAIRSAPPPRALGGSVTAGQPYIVGEQGREMFVPNQSGTIVSNDNLNKGTVVNVNVYANDTEGFDNLLVKRRSVIVNVINDALNSQGKEALV
jgi:hypothetical protein